jgi:ABC-type multidrug transport system fused ATPase/permease subunit
MEIIATSMATDSGDATEGNGVRADAAARSGALPLPAAATTLPALLRDLWGHLSPKRRWQLGLLLAVMIASGLAEAMSLAAVVPFLTVLADPSRVSAIPWVGEQAAALGLSEPSQMLLPLTLLFVGAAMLSIIVRLTNVWLSGRVAAAIASDLSQDAYRRTLYQPYTTHIARNSSGVSTALLTHIPLLNFLVIIPALRVASLCLLIACITVGVLAIDPFVAAVTVVSFGAIYLAASIVTKPRLTANGSLQARHNVALHQTIQEGLGGIRDVLLDHSQAYSVARHRAHDEPLRRLAAEAEVLGALPRFVIEAFGIAGIVALAYWLVTRSSGLAGALPLLGALALAAQRLLPAVHECYYSASQVLNGKASAEAVLQLLAQPMPSIDLAVRPATFQHSIRLANVSYRYGPAMPWVLRNIDLTIAKGDRIALVGPTGSGKSTLADLLMGLLQPTEGHLLIDGHSATPEAWQANIAHVPQAIFLADTSIAENIALGIPPSTVDRNRLRMAATQAQVADFIESLPQGYDTTVGERGTRLSGGQRQRIGIARALYKQAPVLVFDEATSALDDATERALMETLDQLSRELTIVMIAHRLTTTAYCDRVISVHGSGLHEIPTSAASVH